MITNPMDPKSFIDPKKFKEVLDSMGRAEERLRLEKIAEQETAEKKLNMNLIDKMFVERLVILIGMAEGDQWEDLYDYWHEEIYFFDEDKANYIWNMAHKLFELDDQKRLWEDRK